jgi:predicted RNA-binding protein with PIN domain
MERIIIDGYNVIHRVPELRQSLERGLEEARAELILKVKSLLTRKQVEVVLVFDGDHVGETAEPATGNSRLRVVFSRVPLKADALIISFLEEEKQPGRVTLVSDDHEITAFARSVGAKHLSSQAFYDRLARRLGAKELNQKFDSALSPDEIEEWMELFSRSDGDGE